MTTAAAEITSRIAYNRANRDYDCFVTIDDAEEYIGSARNYSEGETKCNAYAYDHYSDTHTPEVAAAIALGDVVVVVDETEACIECDGEGRIPSHDCCGDQAGGWAETCDFCNGTGKADPPADEPAPEPPADDDWVPGGPYARCPGALVSCGLPTPPDQAFCGFCQQKIDRLTAPIAPEPWSVVGPRIWAKVMARITPIEPARCTCGAVATQALPAGRGLVQPMCSVCADGLLLAPVVRRVIEQAA